MLQINSSLHFPSYSNDANIRLYRLQRRSCQALSKIFTSTQMNQSMSASTILSRVSQLHDDSETPDVNNALMRRFSSWKVVIRKSIFRQDAGSKKFKETTIDCSKTSKASFSNMSADLNALLITRGLESSKRYPLHDAQ